MKATHCIRRGDVGGIRGVQSEHLESSDCDQYGAIRCLFFVSLSVTFLSMSIDQGRLVIVWS